jgi:hypothetical protein
MEKNWQYYIRRQIIDELGRMQQEGFHYYSVVIMVQAIEFLGSMLDDKPIRARNQSKNRFRLAVSKLFDIRYQHLNYNDWLYDKLRNHMVHMFIPSSYLLVVSRKEAGNMQNLEKHNGKLIIVSEDLYTDFVKACTKVIYFIDRGKVKPKKIETA